MTMIRFLKVNEKHVLLNDLCVFQVYENRRLRSPTVITSPGLSTKVSLQSITS